jgi:hypothetical protein
VAALEDLAGIDSRPEARLRLLGEISMAAWRSAACTWVRAERGSRSRGAGRRAALLRAVHEAFDAVPGSLALTRPAPGPSVEG